MKVSLSSYEGFLFLVLRYLTPRMKIFKAHVRHVSSRIKASLSRDLKTMTEVVSAITRS